MSLLLSPPEAAELLGCSPNTVRAMVRDGLFTDAWAHTGYRRVAIPRHEVEAFARVPSSVPAQTTPDLPRSGADVVPLTRGGGVAPNDGRSGSGVSDGAA